MKKREQIKNTLQPIIIQELKQYRTAHNLSQENMARMLNVSARTYVDLEHGRFFPAAITLAMFFSNLEAEEFDRMLKTMRTALE